MKSALPKSSNTEHSLTQANPQTFIGPALPFPSSHVQDADKISGGTKQSTSTAHNTQVKPQHCWAASGQRGICFLSVSFFLLLKLNPPKRLQQAQFRR